MNDQSTSLPQNNAINEFKNSTDIDTPSEALILDRYVIDIIEPTTLKDDNVLADTDQLLHDSESLDEDYCTDGNLLHSNMLEEFNILILQRGQNQEKKIVDIVLRKMERDVKSRFDKNSGARYLHECYNDALSDHKFIQWLAKKLNLKTIRLREIISNYPLSPKKWL